MSVGSRFFSPFPSSILLPLLLLFTSNNLSGRASTTPTSALPSSSCGMEGVSMYPIDVTIGYSTHCHSRVLLDCQNNGAVLVIGSELYLVQQLNDKDQTIRVADPGIHRGNLSSCPLNFNTYDPCRKYYNPVLDSSNRKYHNAVLDSSNALVAFIHCLSAVSSVKYVKAPFCGNTSNTFTNSSKVHSYVMVGEYGDDLQVSDLEESCTVDRVVWFLRPEYIMRDNYSLATIYEALAYGAELPLYKDTPEWLWWILGILYYASWLIAALIALKFIIGFPLLIWLVVHTWRRRHLSMDKSIEDFLHGQHNLAPIKYTYSEIKKMTNSFTQKLGEGGCGTVYKGKLRSGPHVAIKVMDQSIASEEEFINEVGTIGRIHHVNIVQLIGFCVEHKKYALVYEFLPNGSLEKNLGSVGLTFEKMLEIALGVARGINYLHHGCNMQILHFDIKPHNILLDDNFHAKISDFGLALLHPIDESFINLTGARGTMGYMAPEMFYGNMGRISYKADIYSFGMMLMEIVSGRRNVNPFVENMGQIHFPSWVYEELRAGRDIDVKDATEDEKRIVKKIVIVALWCIQMRPSDRPPMNKVVEMLESENGPKMPPKPFVAPLEVASHSHDSGIATTYVCDLVPS
ncbi:rust resistance kinase Lr10-like isoform X2 [Andrographis paniculata]|uniref:rust resistance kinase Lr10-like isoform X2 n=1 Tax=Andrographis paniculata TaxID=175694 RepID=UPI0021E78594|nr:rust resistance kinase Lr10-like isoform X2 [Andrographis paniculata]